MRTIERLLCIELWCRKSIIKIWDSAWYIWQNLTKLLNWCCCYLDPQCSPLEPCSDCHWILNWSKYTTAEFKTGQNTQQLNLKLTCNITSTSYWFPLDFWWPTNLDPLYSRDRATPGCLHFTGTGGIAKPSAKALTGIFAVRYARIWSEWTALKLWRQNWEYLKHNKSMNIILIVWEKRDTLRSGAWTGFH